MYGIPLKWIALAIGLIAAATAVTLWFNDKLDTAYRAGQEAEIERVNEITAENNRLNRELEAVAKSGLEEAVEALNRANQRLEEQTEKRFETVRTVIDQTPELSECEIPQSIIDAKNEIRGQVQ